MKVLAFDATAARLTVGIADGQDVMGRWDAPADRHSGNTLDNLIVRALAALQWRREDIEGLAIVTGPGSLTAIRIGWATASGWSVATGVPVTGWPTHQVQWRWWMNPDKNGLRRLDCRQRQCRAEAEIFCMVHHRGDQFYRYRLGPTQPDCPPALVTLGQWQPPGDRLCWIVGPGVLSFRRRWVESLGTKVRIVAPEEAIVGGDQLALWGVESLQLGKILSLSDSPLNYGLPPIFRKAS